MSQQTADELAKAQAVFDSANNVFQQQVDTLLPRIAAEMPDRVDVHLKNIAKQQSTHTSTMTAEEVTALRAEMRKAASDLGGYLTASQSLIRWPAGGRPTTSKIHSALFEVLHPKVGTFDALLRSAGFENRPFTPYIVPQFLYDQTEFSDIADALGTRNDALDRLEAARRAHEQANIDDLWT